MILYFFYAIASTLLGIYVAAQKNRNLWEGFWLGAVFGIIGVIVEALLPSRPVSPPATRSVDDLADYNDLPLVWNENRINADDVDRILADS
jgi:hypothetical protein